MPDHVGFSVADYAKSREFHLQVLEPLGQDHGKPGLRPHYHANDYGAFVLDPDGHNIAAVCHLPE